MTGADTSDSIVKQLRGCESAFSRHEIPEVCVIFRPHPKTEGAGKAGCRLHPWVPCNKKHGGRTTGSTGITPAFPARMVLTVSFVLSPVTGLFCHRHFADHLRESLAPASGRQDHTTSPSAGKLRSSSHLSRPPHPTAR